MISADRNELETQVQRSTVAIREKELAAFTENFAVLSTQAVFLSGLGFGGITMTPIWLPEKMVVWQILFYTACTVGIGFNVLTMCITSWAMIFGPGLGIRGPKGSMSRAVKGMYAERRWALRFYLSGLVSMCIAGVLLAWLKFSCVNQSTNEWEPVCFRAPAVMTSIFFCFMVGVLYHIMYTTRPRFTFKTTEGKTRRPEEAFTLGGEFDPESSSAGPEVRSRRESVAKAVQEIDWLLAQGLISPSEAKEQKNQVISQFVEETVTDPEPSKSTAGSFLGSANNMRKRMSASFVGRSSVESTVSTT